MSPCAKSKRGVVVWDTGGHIVSGACNSPPPPFKCDGSSRCLANCGELCVHAETAALQNVPQGLTNLHMLHVKVVNKAVVPSGYPSCHRCSSQMLAHSALCAMWLLHEEGLRRYDMKEFHLLSLRAKGLPVILDTP